MSSDLEEPDLVRPWEIINIWRELSGEPEKCLLVSADDGQSIIRAKKFILFLTIWNYRIMCENDFELKLI